MSEMIREILIQEQEHLIDLAARLGIDPPDLSERTGKGTRAAASAPRLA